MLHPILFPIFYPLYLILILSTASCQKIKSNENQPLPTLETLEMPNDAIVSHLGEQVAPNVFIYAIKVSPLANDYTNYNQFKSNLNKWKFIIKTTSDNLDKNLDFKDLGLVNLKNHNQENAFLTSDFKEHDGWYYAEKVFSPWENEDLKSKTVELVFTLNNQKYISLFKFIPDVVISKEPPGSNIMLPKAALWELNYLIIEEGLSLTLNNQIQTINAHLIKADNGQIENLSEQQASQPNHHAHGINGGNLAIVTHIADGDIKIIMRGQNGANGINGAPYPPHIRGESGKLGKDTEHHEYPCQDIVTSVPRNQNQIARMERCSDCKPPTNGEDGKMGLIGNAGQNGLNGGNTGTLKFTVKNPTANFKIDTQIIAGQGGQAGVGGPGSLGGPGGNGGRPHPYCKMYKGGANGLEGPNGQAGLSGVNGQNGLTTAPEIILGNIRL